MATAKKAKAKPAESVRTSEAREQLSEIINRVKFGGERVVLKRHGKPVAAVISIEELREIEAAEDRIDLREALKARKDPRPPIPWEKVKKKLGL